MRDRRGVAGDLIDFEGVCGHRRDVAFIVAFDRDEVLVAESVAQGVVHGIVDGDCGGRAHGGFAHRHEDFGDVALKIQKCGEYNEERGEENRGELALAALL